MAYQAHAQAAAGPLSPEPCDPASGEHVFQQYIRRAHETLAAHWDVRRLLVRPRTDSGRARHPDTVAEMLPGVLEDLAIDPPEDVLLIAPARLVRGGSGSGRRLALLRLTTHPVGTPALGGMLQALLRELLPGERYRLLPEAHPLTRESMALQIAAAAAWAPLGHCGQLTHTALATAGLDADAYRGLLVELDLDQLHTLHQSHVALAAG